MRRRVEGDGCQTNIWLVTEWLTSGHMQSSNHVYGLQKAVDDDWLICKAVWHLYLKPTPKHVPLSLSNLLRLLPCVLSYNIQIHVCLVFYYVFFVQPAQNTGEELKHFWVRFHGLRTQDASVHSSQTFVQKGLIPTRTS